MAASMSSPMGLLPAPNCARRLPAWGKWNIEIVKRSSTGQRLRGLAPAMPPIGHRANIRPGSVDAAAFAKDWEKTIESATAWLTVRPPPSPPPSASLRDGSQDTAKPAEIMSHTPMNRVFIRLSVAACCSRRIPALGNFDSPKPSTHPRSGAVVIRSSGCCGLAGVARVPPLLPHLRRERRSAGAGRPAGVITVMPSLRCSVNVPLFVSVFLVILVLFRTDRDCLHSG